MEMPVLIAGVAVVLLVAGCVLTGVLVVLLRSRSESRRELVAARAESTELRRRLDALAERVEQASVEMIRVDDPAYVITDAGSAHREPTIADRVVLSATVGEPLVKAVALGHGLRRALSPETRNRIRFEMRREVRRSRKQRRRETKDAWRRMQTEDRAA